jgi:Plasmid encoded RepA protein
MDDAQADLFANLTPVRRRRLRTSLEIQDSPAQRIAYQHTVLCQTCLPYRNPGEHLRIWERYQGAVVLKVIAGEARNPRTRSFVEVGLPFGSRPRLILAHLNREALLKGSPEIEVEHSLTAFVRRMQRTDPNGREIRRFKEQMTRLSAALVRLAFDASDEHAYQIDTKIITAFELWSRTHESQLVLSPSVVRLSQEYFDSLTRHAVPLDERAIAALSNSALALDVYAWLAQRLHRIPEGKPQFISWKVLHEQFGPTYTRLRAFRFEFLKVLSLVHTQYHTARVQADERGIELRHSLPPVPARLAPVAKLLK